MIDTGAEVVATKELNMLYNRRPCDKIVIGFNGKATRCITMGDVYLLLDTGVELQRREKF